jgi:MoaA/NifB/PqqE/SkfB family radical SAM enzyme
VRLLAWPDYRSRRELEAVAAFFDGAVLPEPLCLCLRHDPERGDPPLEAVVPELERALAPLLRVNALEVLVVDGPLAPEDLPRLGAAVTAALALPSSAGGPRAGLLAALGRPALPAVRVPRQRNDMRHLLALTRLFLEPLADPAARLAYVARFASWQPGYRPALAVQAELLLAAGRRDEAAALLRTCLSRLYDDVHVQGLFLEATGGRSPLRAPERRRLFCMQPFTDFEILDGGDVYLCSNVNLPFPAGNVNASSWQEIWNSEAAQELRRSVLDGDFRYCSPMTCPMQHDLPRRDALAAEDRPFLERRMLRVEEPPRRVSLAYDRSCNLRCPSCRNHPIASGAGERRALDELGERVVLPLLAGARVAHVTGSGDPIASAHYRRLLGRLVPEVYPRLVVDMMTNGTLLTPEVWEGELRHLHGRMREIAVSLDGATRETYEALRPGARFDVVCANLAHLAAARRKGELDGLAVNMVVQACNFHEMGDLVRRCLAWGVDQVRFYKLRQWGTYRPEDFLARDVVSPKHPRHGELLAALRDPVLTDPVVFPFELGHLIPRRAAA